MFPATPLQYLERWSVGNNLFGDDAEFVGLSADRSRLIMSQRDVAGDAPTWDELDAAFAVQFDLRRLFPSRLLGAYESRAYFSGRIGVFDVRPLNCVRTSSGLVVPIDVIPQFFSRVDADVLKTFLR
jgi:hypothetical protein